MSFSEYGMPSAGCLLQTQMTPTAPVVFFPSMPTLSGTKYARLRERRELLGVDVFEAVEVARELERAAGVFCGWGFSDSELEPAVLDFVHERAEDVYGFFECADVQRDACGLPEGAEEVCEELAQGCFDVLCESGCEERVHRAGELFRRVSRGRLLRGSQRRAGPAAHRRELLGEAHR